MNVQEKIMDALKLCGPGKYPPSKKDDAVGIIAKSGGFRNEIKPDNKRPPALICKDMTRLGQFDSIYFSWQSWRIPTDRFCTRL